MDADTHHDARILLVEDDSATAQGLELMLKGRGYTHFYSTDLVQEAIDLLSQYDYDLVILDLTLPDGHGFQVLTHLTRSFPLPIAVVVLTGNADIDTKIRAFEIASGNVTDFDYVTKPFNIDELNARMKYYVSNVRHRRKLVRSLSEAKYQDEISMLRKEVTDIRGVLARMEDRTNSFLRSIGNDVLRGLILGAFVLVTLASVEAGWLDAALEWLGLR